MMRICNKSASKVKLGQLTQACQRISQIQAERKYGASVWLAQAKLCVERAARCEDLRGVRHDQLRRMSRRIDSFVVMSVESKGHMAGAR